WRSRTRRVPVETSVTHTSELPGKLPRGGWDCLRLAALIGALTVLGAGSSGVLRVVGAPSDRAAQNGAAWEARRLVAQLLWVQTHAVLHAGVEEREARPGEENSRADEIRQHEAAEHGLSAE